MPTLYVANTTSQNHDFVYIMPEETRSRRQQIKPGTQIVVNRPDLSTPEVNSIIEQHRRYGLIGTHEIDQRKPYTGLVYSVDKPVKIEKMKALYEANADVTKKASQEGRKQSAAVLHNLIEADIGRPGAVRNVTIEVVEGNKATEPGMNEIITSSRDGGGQGTTPAASAPRRRRKAA